MLSEIVNEDDLPRRSQSDQTRSRGKMCGGKVGVETEAGVEPDAGVGPEADLGADLARRLTMIGAWAE